MTNYWNYLGNGIQTFMGSNNSAIKFEFQNIFGVINDNQKYSYNSIIINTNNAIAQQSLMLKYSNYPLFVYVSQKSINAFNAWNKNFYFKPRGKTIVLKKVGKLSLPPSNSKIGLDIILAETESHLKDIVDLENKGKTNIKNTVKVFNEDFLNNKNIKTFIAYHKDIPVSKISVVLENEIATLWGMKTDPEYEQMGAMILLGEYLINHNIDNFNIQEHYAIPFAMPVFQSSVNRGAQSVEEVYLFYSEANK
jgi:hypothetical protein